jgi:hypothetical protein
MKNKSVRLALVSVVAVLSVFGLSQSPADASDRSPGQRTVCCY